jgi:3-methylfumaryl-CoA hydratase
MAVDIEALRKWVGRSATADDVVTPFPVAAMSATLDRDDAPPRDGDPLPPLWHWLYFLTVYRQSEAGPDGHMQRGGFLPPVPLPRRMWAGSRVQFRQALRVGEPIRRISTVADVTHKSGRSGDLVFVVVRHEISTDGGIAVSEEHDIVYREAPRSGDRSQEPASAPSSAPVDAPWQRSVQPDPLLLFRYSALTFNGHRIHYDRSYVTEVEGYAGLVVHGPLLATLMLDLVRRERPDAGITHFDFRALRPVLDTAAFAVCGAPGPGTNEVALWVRGSDGARAMEGSATLA